MHQRTAAPKEEENAERLPLLTTKAKNVDRVGNVFRQVDFLVVFIVPFTFYLATGLLWTYSFLYSPKFCVYWSLFLILGILVYGAMSKAKYKPTLCILSICAVLLGSFLGLYLFDEAAIFPEFYKNTRKYTNVVPAQPAAAVSDAGKIVFSAETFVDTSQSVGLIEENGMKYCVAPIRDGSGIQRIEFWAAGIGCCGAKGDFYCDAANNADAKAGIVIFDNNGYFENARFDLYDKARKKAQAEYSLQSVSYPIYVRWVQESNLDMLSHSYRNQAILLGLLLYFLGFVICGVTAYSMFDPQMKTGPSVLGLSAIRGGPPP